LTVGGEDSADGMAGDKTPAEIHMCWCFVSSFRGASARFARPLGVGINRCLVALLLDRLDQRLLALLRRIESHETVLGLEPNDDLLDAWELLQSPFRAVRSTIAVPALDLER